VSESAWPRDSDAADGGRPAERQATLYFKATRLCALSHSRQSVAVRVPVGISGLFSQSGNGALFGAVIFFNIFR
jgi:hypothetical protein